VQHHKSCIVGPSYRSLPSEVWNGRSSIFLLRKNSICCPSFPHTNSCSLGCIILDSSGQNAHLLLKRHKGCSVNIEIERELEWSTELYMRNMPSSQHLTKEDCKINWGTYLISCTFQRWSWESLYRSIARRRRGAPLGCPPGEPRSRGGTIWNVPWNRRRRPSSPWWTLRDTGTERPATNISMFSTPSDPNYLAQT
jgi:hypothetical protein